jgi:hypothetical protein
MKKNMFRNLDHNSKVCFVIAHGDLHLSSASFRFVERCDGYVGESSRQRLRAWLAMLELEADSEARRKENLLTRFSALSFWLQASDSCFY